MVASTTKNQLYRCLHNVRFPASKDDLVTAAIDSGCNENTVAALREVSSITYSNADQVCASVNIVDVVADASNGS